MPDDEEQISLDQLADAVADRVEKRLKEAERKTPPAPLQTAAKKFGEFTIPRGYRVVNFVIPSFLDSDLIA